MFYFLCFFGQLLQRSQSITIYVRYCLSTNVNVSRRFSEWIFLVYCVLGSNTNFWGWVWDMRSLSVCLCFIFYVFLDDCCNVHNLLLFMLDIVWVRMWMWADDSVSEWVLLVQVCFIGIFGKGQVFYWYVLIYVFIDNWLFVLLVHVWNIIDYMTNVWCSYL